MKEEYILYVRIICLGLVLPYSLTFLITVLSEPLHSRGIGLTREMQVINKHNLQVEHKIGVTSKLKTILPTSIIDELRSYQFLPLSG